MRLQTIVPRNQFIFVERNTKSKYAHKDTNLLVLRSENITGIFDTPVIVDISLQRSKSDNTRYPSSVAISIKNTFDIESIESIPKVKLIFSLIKAKFYICKPNSNICFAFPTKDPNFFMELRVVHI